MKKNEDKYLNGIRTYRFLYEFIKWTGILPMLLFLRPKISYVDKKAVKALKGPFLITSNHRTMIDPLIITFAFPFKYMFYVAQEQLFEVPAKGWLFSQVNCIKIDRKNIDMETFRTIGRKLKKGYPVCIFPEGRVQSGNSEGFKGGGAMIALTNNVPVLPIHLEERKSIWHCSRLVVGKPIYLDEVVGQSRSMMSVNKLTDYLFEKEKELESYYKEEK